MLFHATVRENIAYGRPSATHAEVLEAARIANVDEFVERLPNGYDTVLGDRGVTLSGGQRQRIAIARAVVRDSPILVLDEPTAGLDSASVWLVLVALDRLESGRTTILVTHRYETPEAADEIIVLMGGRIVERGTLRDLVERGGAFARLHARFRLAV